MVTLAKSVYPEKKAQIALNKLVKLIQLVKIVKLEWNSSSGRNAQFSWIDASG